MSPLLLENYWENANIPYVVPGTRQMYLFSLIPKMSSVCCSCRSRLLYGDSSDGEINLALLSYVFEKPHATKAALGLNSIIWKTNFKNITSSKIWFAF